MTAALNRLKTDLLAFRQLTCLFLERADDGSWDLELKLNDGFDAILAVTFIGCIDLTLGDVVQSPAVELHIYDVRDWQREGAYFKIVDEEGSGLVFFCKSIKHNADWAERSSR